MQQKERTDPMANSHIRICFRLQSSCLLLYEAEIWGLSVSFIIYGLSGVLCSSFVERVVKNIPTLG